MSRPGVVQGRRQPGQDGQVYEEPHTGQTAHTQRQHSPLVLPNAELALNGTASPSQAPLGIDRRSLQRPLVAHCPVEPLEPRARRDHVRGHMRAKTSKIALRHDDGEVDQRVLKSSQSGRSRP